MTDGVLLKEIQKVGASPAPASTVGSTVGAGAAVTPGRRGLPELVSPGAPASPRVGAGVMHCV